MAGRGFIRQVSPGTWDVRYSLGVKDENGRYRQLSRRVKGTRRDAQREMAQFITETELVRRTGIELPGVQANAGCTVSAAVNDWLALPTVSVRWRELSGCLLRRHALPALGAMRVDAVAPEHLDRLYTSMTERGYAPKTVRHVHTSLSAAFAAAEKRGLIDRNPARGSTPPPLSRPDITPPSASQVIRLLRSVEGQEPRWLTPLLRLAVVTGARRGELCALRWTDFIPSTKTLVIRRALTEIKGNVETKAPKNGRDRVLALDDVTITILIQWRESLPESSGWIFPSPSGGVLRPSSVSRVVAREVQRIEGGFGLHALRHFAATQSLAAGVDVRTVAGRLGHARASMTLDVYASFLPAADARAAELMAEVIRPCTGGGANVPT